MGLAVAEVVGHAEAVPTAGEPGRCPRSLDFAVVVRVRMYCGHRHLSLPYPWNLVTQRKSRSGATDEVAEVSLTGRVSSRFVASVVPRSVRMRPSATPAAAPRCLPAERELHSGWSPTRRRWWRVDG